jgi:chromosome segregation ATPase
MVMIRNFFHQSRKEEAKQLTGQYDTQLASLKSELQKSKAKCEKLEEQVVKYSTSRTELHRHHEESKRTITQLLSTISNLESKLHHAQSQLKELIHRQGLSDTERRRLSKMIQLSHFLYRK